jgi:DNA modification methylase
MHAEWDAVWAEAWRVLRPGGIAAINIGDATRNLGGSFRLWSNHARILHAAEALGFEVLPDILWNKPTNAPNKFMGSGMLPAGAYVTYEHEYVLLLRKGGKRVFLPAEKALRARSAFFWEERNVWFSDLWQGIRGTPQELDGDRALRERSGAFPFEIPYRLIQMFSLQGETVLDPFLGTGTTSLAAAASGRSSVGLEWDPFLLGAVPPRLGRALELGQARVAHRLAAHRRFVADRVAAGGTLAHHNEVYGFPVMTGQETKLALARPVDARLRPDACFEVDYFLDERLDGGLFGSLYEA